MIVDASSEEQIRYVEQQQEEPSLRCHLPLLRSPNLEQLWHCETFPIITIFLNFSVQISECFDLKKPLFKIETRSLRDPRRLSTEREVVVLGGVVNGAEPNRILKVIALEKAGT